MSIEEEYEQELDKVVKSISVRYMADLIAIKVECENEYFIVKSLRLARRSFVTMETFKEELCKCERPLVISDIGMRIKKDSKKLAKQIIDIIDGDS